MSNRARQGRGLTLSLGALLLSLPLSQLFAAAPPWAAPDRAAMAAVIAACRFASVPATTRAVNVEALAPCSACRIMSVSMSRAVSALGTLPVTI